MKRVFLVLVKQSSSGAISWLSFKIYGQEHFRYWEFNWLNLKSNLSWYCEIKKIYINENN